MAVDLYPYSGRLGGTVTDLEHEALWSPIADGVLPGQPTTALAVGIAGGTWTVQPGKFHIAGHVLDIDTVQSGPLPPGASATRQSIVVAYVDRSQSPWTYGVRLVTGSPGGGRPNLPPSELGLYQVPLRSFTTAPSGATTLLVDERPFLRKVGADTTDWTPYLPGFVGSGSPSFNHTGRWKRIGLRTVLFKIQVTFRAPGNGDGICQTNLPTIPNRSMRHVFTGHSENPGAVLVPMCLSGIGPSRTIDRILWNNSAQIKNMQGDDITRTGGEDTVITISGSYEEA